VSAFETFVRFKFLSNKKSSWQQDLSTIRMEFDIGNLVSHDALLLESMSLSMVSAWQVLDDPLLISIFKG
jgi:hypothetical protein